MSHLDPLYVTKGKAKPNRTRLIVGGDRIHYLHSYGMLMADLLTIKMLLNGVILTLKAKFMTIDVKKISKHPTKEIQISPSHDRRYPR